MKATEILKEEHRVIERVLDSLEEATRIAARGGNVRPGFFVDASDFIRGFADGCHHRKEEGVLFKAMQEAGISVQGGPIGMMLAEHEQGRVFTRGMRAAAEKWGAGDGPSRQAVIQNATSYINLLRQHISKEDALLFPMTDRSIPAEKQAGVSEAFEHVEHEETGEGVHEKFLGMVQALEKEIAV